MTAFARYSGKCLGSPSSQTQWFSSSQCGGVSKLEQTEMGDWTQKFPFWSLKTDGKLKSDGNSVELEDYGAEDFEFLTWPKWGREWPGIFELQTQRIS